MNHPTFRAFLRSVERPAGAMLLCLLLQASPPALSGPVFRLDVEPEHRVGNQIVIVEIGPLNATTYIWPTHKGRFFVPEGGGGGFVGKKGTLSVPVPALGPTRGSQTFTFDSVIRKVPVTDYAQQTGDPSILQASAFEAGVMVDSLWDWLYQNGYQGDNPIYQPDFFLVGGGDVYYAVDLAALGGAGKDLVDTSLGAIFSINAAGGMDAMPFYQFSSTPFAYTEGFGWTGGTPLAEGTRLSLDAFHETSAQVPEPASLWLLGLGLAGAWLTRKPARTVRN